MQTVGDKVSGLDVSPHIVVGFVDFLSFGEADVHEIHFSSEIQAVLEPRKFSSGAKIVGAFILALHVDGCRHSYKHLVEVQLAGIALCCRHHSLGLECETGAV